MSVPDDNVFKDALRALMVDEGGVANRPAWADPGGLTNLGITHGTLASYRQRYPDDDDMPDNVRLLQRHQAERIYRRLYWEACKCDNLPPSIASVVFDGAVLSGPARSARWLQEALGVKADGWIGPQTIAAAWRVYDRSVVAGDIIARREAWMRGLANAKHNPGWWPRLKRVLARAKAMEGEVA